VLLPIHLFLVRAAATPWCEQHRIVGRTDVGLSERGRTQAERAVQALSALEVAEIIASPMARALQTAECFARRFAVSVTRDQRLAEITMGRWEGRPRSELHADAAYQRFLSGSANAWCFEEPVEQVLARTTASMRQALADNAHEGNIVIVSHSAPLRILLTGYLRMAAAHFHRLQLDHGSISVVRCSDYPEHARVLSVNWTGEDLAALMQGEC
jgi:broad specificity phosphatase PhoE